MTNKAQYVFGVGTNPRKYSYKPTTIEGFYLWLVAKNKTKQSKYFKFALGRLARENPTADPRLVVLEWFAEEMYAYEQWLKKVRKAYVKAKQAQEGSSSESVSFTDCDESPDD